MMLEDDNHSSLSSSPISCEQMAELEQDYLLGMLQNTSKERQVVRHLDNCANCNQRLNQYAEVLGQMFEAVEPVAPPVAVRATLLQQINQEISHPASHSAKTGKPRRLSQPQTRRGWFELAATGIAAALILGLTLGLFSLNNQLEQTRQMFALAAAPDSLVWDMTPPQNGNPAPAQTFDPAAPFARMYVRPNTDTYYVIARNLKPTPPNLAYYVWYTTPQIEAGGRLTPDSQGMATLLIHDDKRQGTQIKSCFITLEQAGSPPNQPTSAALLEWRKG